MGADEFLAMMEGKIRVTHFLKDQSGKITFQYGKTSAAMGCLEVSFNCNEAKFI